MRPATSERRHTLGSTAIVSLFAGLGMVLGLGTNTLIARNFGASRAVDALVLARSVPDFLIMLLGLDLLRGITTTLFSASGSTEEERRDLYASLFTWVFAISGVAAVLTFFGASWLMSLLAPGFEPGAHLQATQLCRVLIPVLPLLALAYFVGAVGNAHRRFTLPATIRALPHVGAIAFILLFSRSMGVGSVAVGLVAGSALTLIVQFIGLKGLGMRPRLRRMAWTPPVRKAAVLALPLMVVMVASQASVLATRNLGSHLAAGRISALWFALMLFGLARGVVVDPVCTVSLPRLSSLAGEPKSSALRDAFISAARLLMLMTIPACVALIFGAHPIIKLLYQRGAFSPETTHITALAVVYYGGGLPFMALAWLMLQMFIALQDTKALMKISTVAYLLQIALCVALVKPLDYLGLALAQSLAMGVYAVLLALGLRRRMGLIGGTQIAWSVLRCSGAGAVMAGVMLALQRLGIGTAARLSHLLPQVALLLVAAAATYLAACTVLFPGAVQQARELLLRKPRRPASGESVGAGGEGR